MSGTQELSRLDDKELESWLQSRLIDAHCDDPDLRSRAMDFSDFGIADPESLLFALETLFKRLDVRSRQRFRRAVGSLISHAIPDEFPIDGMKALIALLGITRASSELVTLESVFGSGVWGLREPSLFTAALSVLKGLKKSRTARQTVKHLVYTANFPRPYVFDAYEVLIGSSPENWHVDLKELDDMMTAIGVQVSESRSPEQRRLLDSRYERLANLLLRQVSLTRLKQGIAYFSHRPKYLSYLHPIGLILRKWVEGTKAGGFLRGYRSGYLLLVGPNGKRIEISLNELPDGGAIFLATMPIRLEPRNQPVAYRIPAALEERLEEMCANMSSLPYTKPDTPRNVARPHQ